MRKQALLLFVILVAGGSLLTAMSVVGDIVEKILSFFDTVLSYFVVVMLFAHYKGVQFFSKVVLQYFSGAFIFFTLAEALYPIYAYREQTLPTDYLTVLCVQLILNLFIVKVILSEPTDSKSN